MFQQTPSHSDHPATHGNKIFCLFLWGVGFVKKQNKTNKKILCCQLVRPLPLQPRPVHNAMSKDQLHTQQVYEG